VKNKRALEYLVKETKKQELELQKKIQRFRKNKKDSGSPVN